MISTGSGAIIIWNDVTAEGRAEFYEWHNRQHIPERVAIAGFSSGSRYRAAKASSRPEFLTVYALAAPHVATSAEYLARLNSPTPETKRSTAHFRNTSRALTEIVQAAGHGRGGVVGVLRFEASEAGRAAFARLKAASSLAEQLASRPRISRVAVCATDDGASGAKTAESRGRTDILAAPCGAFLVEGCDEPAVEAALALASNAAGGEAGAGLASGVYLLEFALIR